MLIVLCSWHLVAFGFLMVVINIDFFRCVAQYPCCIIMSLRKFVGFSIGPSSNAFSGDQVCASCVFCGTFHLCRFNLGPLLSLISGLVILLSPYRSHMYAVHMFMCTSLKKKHNCIVMFVHDPYCAGRPSTMRYTPDLFVHLPC